MNINQMFRRMKLYSFVTILSIILLGSCSKSTLSPDYVGEWKTGKTNIMVRTEPKWMKFNFYQDSATVTIQIKSDKTVSGSIGSAEFKTGKLKKNWGLPSSWTGVSYVVVCGSIGKIYTNDPLSDKEVEIWLSPATSSGEMAAELRYTENKAQFPMADLKFKKVK
ncbi:MAG: hypothetical protein WCO63_07495 [Bacteroidota bacterium]